MYKCYQNGFSHCCIYRDGLCIESNLQCSNSWICFVCDYFFPPQFHSSTSAFTVNNTEYSHVFNPTEFYSPQVNGCQSVGCWSDNRQRQILTCKRPCSPRYNLQGRLPATQGPRKCDEILKYLTVTVSLPDVLCDIKVAAPKSDPPRRQVSHSRTRRAALVCGPCLLDKKNPQMQQITGYKSFFLALLKCYLKECIKRFVKWDFGLSEGLIPASSSCFCRSEVQNKARLKH